MLKDLRRDADARAMQEARVRARIEPAPPAPIAVAARAFGDVFPPASPQRWIRVSAVVLAMASAWYVPWMLSSFNPHALWLAFPFAAANLFTIVLGLLTVANSWHRSIPVPTLQPSGSEPQVGVIVPTYGEPIAMILRTITSVLEQDWPEDRLVVVVSDDGHDPRLRDALESWPVLYYEPPPRDAPGRDGAAKSGNLNAALEFLRAMHPELRYIETRDADDELGSNGFLRQIIGQLERDPKLGLVQTIR